MWCGGGVCVYVCVWSRVGAAFGRRESGREAPTDYLGQSNLRGPLHMTVCQAWGVRLDTHDRTADEARAALGRRVDAPVMRARRVRLARLVRSVGPTEADGVRSVDLMGRRAPHA